MKSTIVKAFIVMLVAFFSMQFHAIFGSYQRSQVLLDATANHVQPLPPIVHGMSTSLR